MPKNSDLGGYHFAFYVDDMDKAVTYLKSKGVKFLGEPTTMTAGPTAGETWGYFLAPWGMNLLSEGQGLREGVQDPALECQGSEQVTGRRPGSPGCDA